MVPVSAWLTGQVAFASSAALPKSSEEMPATVPVAPGMAVVPATPPAANPALAPLARLFLDYDGTVWRATGRLPDEASLHRVAEMHRLRIRQPDHWRGMEAHADDEAFREMLMHA